MHNPIIKHAKQLQTLLIKSKTQPSSALYLLENNARTPLFMLESIARILFKQNEIMYAKWLKVSKKLEDCLGTLDYYATYLKENKNVNYFSTEEIAYINKKHNKALNKLNEKLADKDYYLDWVDALLKSEINFNSAENKKFIKELCKKELIKCAEFFNDFTNGFNDMELQVHELRRKLRWISIYAKSFDGLFAYKTSRVAFKWEKEFISKLETTSKFNVLPIEKSIKVPIQLNKKAFYALSSVIRQLGDIKDQGLKAHTKKYTEEKLKIKANPLAIKKRLDEEAKLLKDAHVLLKSFFETHKIHLLIIEN